MPEYEAFGILTETPEAVVMKSSAMAATAIVGSLVSAAGPYEPWRVSASVGNIAACSAAIFQTSVGKDGLT
jgi:hypothetical protein